MQRSSTVTSSGLIPAPSGNSYWSPFPYVFPFTQNEPYFKDIVEYCKPREKRGMKNINHGPSTNHAFDRLLFALQGYHQGIMVLSSKNVNNDQKTPSIGRQSYSVLRGS